MTEPYKPTVDEARAEAEQVLRMIDNGLNYGDAGQFYPGMDLIESALRALLEVTHD